MPSSRRGPPIPGPNPKEAPQHALARLLRDCQARQGWKVAPKAKELGIDRRKLSALLEARATTIQFSELEALAHLLQQSGVRIGEMFEMRSLIGELSKSAKVAFLFGAKPERPGPGTSWWDLRSLSDTILSLNNASSRLASWELFDVPEAEHPDALDAENYAEQLDGAPWLDLLRDDSVYSIVSFGSPLANHASEVMLASMFGVAPFARDTAGLPFKYIWSDRRFEERPSSFAARGTRHARIEKRHMSDTWSVWGMEIRGDLYPIDRNEDPSTTYGVVATQRRQGGQIWVVVAGATGPGTYAASRLLRDHPGPPEAPGAGRASKTSWIPIQASDRGNETRKTQTVFDEARLDRERDGHHWPESRGHRDESQA